MNRIACRSCRRSQAEVFLNLGELPLANALISPGQASLPEPRYPLACAFCSHCGLVQLTEEVAAEKLFRQYVYFSSFSDAMLEHSRTMSAELIADRRLGPASLVVEAASNDGYLLQYYQRAGVPVLGIEPAVNIAAVARKRHGIETLSEFFTHDFATQLRSQGHAADLFHAHNVLAHVPDPNGFVAGIREILKETGVAVIEVPYVGDMIDRVEFDTIYHEHLCYFSLTALDHLFARNELQIADVRRLPIHGGTLRLYATRSSAAGVGHRNRVEAMLADERRRGLTAAPYYAGFSRRVNHLKHDLTGLLQRLKGAGHRIAAYGASAKGATLLNYCGIGRETIDFIADRSSVKQGLLAPGNQIPILPPSALMERRPDYTLLLTWNFRDEILAQQAPYREAGGKFIIPIPEPTIV